jgi:hypothetical protein
MNDVPTIGWLVGWVMVDAMLDGCCVCIGNSSVLPVEQVTSPC